jgi:predicted  nucleic acid-binding Zn-ribbon protein
MMSSEDESKEEVICPVCSRFESQAWRKKFCRNCFHSLDEHSEDGEKESAGHEKVENEKNLKNTDEKKDTEDKTDKISKDKLLKEDKNKTSKTSTDKSLPDKDKTASKQNEKTSALADKISKKLTGSTGTNKTIDKKVEEKVKTSSTDNLKSKFESSKKTNEHQGDNIDSKKLDEKQSKLDGDKSKLWGGKAKGADTSDEKSKKDKEADKSDQKLNLKDKEMKSDLKDKLDNVKSKSDFDKTKPLDAKSKFESKSHGSKEGTPSAEEKDGTTSNTSKKDDKQKQTEDEHMSGSKMFKLPEKTDTKMKWKDMWGSTLPSKTDEKTKVVDTKTEKTNDEDDEEITSNKDLIKAKFESKDTGNLWGVIKPTEKSATSKLSPKETEKSISGDKVVHKEVEKSTADDKITPEEPAKSKFGDKIYSKEPEKSKFGDKITPKEPEKSKFGDKITSKEPEKSKFGDKITSKEPEKSKFGDKITSKEPEKSKFGEKITSKEPEKSKFGDKVNTKDNEKSKFGDKINPKEHEKHKFGDSKTNINSSDGKGTSTDNEKSKTNEAKQKLDKLKNIKSEEKTKLEESKSKIDTKNDLFGSKSKFDKNDKFSDLKSNKNFGVELKGKNDDKKKAGYLDQKSDIENQKNEKLEGKLKLDIKKTENSSKSEKDSSSVSHSLADRLKDKYEKISKTSTPNTPSKTNDIKTYGRSKSDGSIINDQPPDKKSAIASPEIKSQPSTGNTQHKLSSQTMTDDKKQELLDEEKAKSPRNKPTQYEEGELPGMVNEVKEDETTPSSESLPKLNTDDINKIKEAAKFLLIDDDFDDVRYNSLGRRNSGNKSTPSQQATSSLSSSATLQADDGTASIGTGSHDKHSVQGTTIISNTNLGKEKHDVENIFNEKFNSETERLKKQLKQMEERCSELEEENKNLKNGLLENEKHSGRLMKQKQDVENSIKVLQRSLTSIESKCSKLETENSNLIERIKIAQAKCDGNTAMELKEAHIDELKHLQERLAMGENIVEELRDDNDNLKQEILDLKGEMEEMYDTFRDQEAEEFRDVQREMEMHAKNCRVLSFKLRKYERLNDQLEAEKENCEDKLRMLQNQISDGDTRAHIRDIEDELRLAKEVSVRLHDELDILEEKKCKSEDENHQLTQILEQSDKKQFRLEMEVDKLRDQVRKITLCCNFN